MTISDQAQTVTRPDPAASRAGGPTFTVVIAWSGAQRWLAACLYSLIPQCLRSGTELVIARADPPSAMPQLSAAYPYVRFVSAPPRTTLPDLRVAGFAAARGDVIAFLDDADARMVPDDCWVERLRSLRALGPGSESDKQLDAGSTTQTADVGGRDGTVQFVPYTASPVADERRHPYLSVVVPVHQAGDVLYHSLEALVASDLPRTEWELIVVDDASTDDTSMIASQYADVVIRLPGSPHGPAYARNRGFEFTRGEYVAFIDADVCIHRDTLARFVLVLSREPDVSAVFGSFDDRPVARGLVSQYRNLLAHYYHQQHPGIAETFWASCGAIRSAAFAEVGMFDEWRFPRHQVEDFELGYQLRARGRRVVLRPEIQATPLKRWSLGSMIAADLQDRSVPWMRIFAKRGATLQRRKERLRIVKSVNAALTWLALAFVLGAVFADRPGLLVLAGVSLLLVLINDRAQRRFFARQRGTWFAVGVVPLQLMSYLVNGMAVTVGWVLRELLGEPTPHPTVEAFAEVGVKMWPPVPTSRAGAASETSGAR
jgi:glycosyltransferase involved in cell wall biosynthesis